MSVVPTRGSFYTSRKDFFLHIGVNKFNFSYIIDSLLISTVLTNYKPYQESKAYLLLCVSLVQIASQGAVWLRCGCQSVAARCPRTRPTLLYDPRQSAQIMACLRDLFNNKFIYYACTLLNTNIINLKEELYVTPAQLSHSTNCDKI